MGNGSGGERELGNNRLSDNLNTFNNGQERNNKIE